jgi:IS30 family transposase
MVLTLPLICFIAYRELMVVGWETSRHPEWEIMYAAGLTVREISNRVGWARSTVHRHLQVREGHIPGLRATHEAALATRPSGWQRYSKQELQAADDDTG